MTGGVDHLLGLIKVKVIRGLNLAIRDAVSSDPYVVIKMGDHKLKTHVIRKNLNPEWNEELTLSVTDPNQLIEVQVFDWDRLSLDDKMGNAEISIQPLVDAVKSRPEGLPDGAMINKIVPSRQNCFAEESAIRWSKGKVVQDVVLRLKNVESGEVEMQLQWVSIPNARSL